MIGHYFLFKKESTYMHNIPTHTHTTHTQKVIRKHPAMSQAQQQHKQKNSSMHQNSLASMVNKF